ncbi:MAG TPA: 30S ribosomal protein S21 [Candidatus Cybelea sp.]
MYEIKLGDVVRVAAARRRDVSWKVVQITPEQVVVAINDRGGEIRYRAESLERVDPDGTPQPEHELADLDEASLAERPKHRWPRGQQPGVVGDRASVTLQPGEPIEYAVKRFGKCVQRSGILQEYKEHRYFKSPGEKRREKSRRARHRRATTDAANLESSRSRGL